MNLQVTIKRTSNESKAAVALKKSSMRRAALSGLYDLIESERYRADFIGVRISPFRIDFFEVETRDHPHAIVNFRRNRRTLTTAATRTIMICPNDRVAQKLSERIARDLKEEERTKVTVTTMKGIYDALKSINQ